MDYPNNHRNDGEEIGFLLCVFIIPLVIMLAIGISSYITDKRKANCYIDNIEIKHEEPMKVSLIDKIKNEFTTNAYISSGLLTGGTSLSRNPVNYVNFLYGENNTPILGYVPVIVTYDKVDKKTGERERLTFKKDLKFPIYKNDISSTLKRTCNEVRFD